MEKLDENIKELLSENKKSLTLNQEKKHWKTLRKSDINSLCPLAKLWSIMEAEQEILLENDDKAISVYMEVAGLSEQKILHIV